MTTHHGASSSYEGYRTYSMAIPTTVFIIALLLSGSWALPVSSRDRISFVTGANGYLGREIVHELLRSNINDGNLQVNRICCLVRSSRVDRECQYWKDHSDCIDVRPYDMLDGGQSIEDALLSAPSDFDKVVYHVASVFGPTDDHRQTALDNVKGTEDLVKTLSKFPKALLVLTSSMAAVRGTGQVPLNGKYYTCEDFNTLSELGKNWGSSYQWSKAESERRAWELSKSLKVPMVSLCPAFIFGPTSDGSFANTKSYSITLVEQWLRGESQVQSRLCVDVRDVAKAHVAAGTLPNAVGKRFVVSTERRIPSKTTAETLREISPTPEKITFDASFDGGAIKIGEQEVLSEERLQRELGVLLTSPQTTFREMGRIIMSKGGSSSSG